MHSKNSKLASIGLAAATLLLTHCAGNATAPDNSARTAAVGRMQPLVQSIGGYADTLSVTGSGQPVEAGMQAANTLGSALVHGSRLPVDKVARAVKASRAKISAVVNDVLTRRVFLPENVESVDGDTTVYLLHGDAVCTDPNGINNDHCINDIDKLAIRCTVVQSGQDQNIAVRVGSATSDAITMQYHNGTQAISADGDVAQLEGVLNSLGLTSGPVQDSGHVTVSLSRAGDKIASLAFGISQPLQVQDGKGGTVTFAVAPQAIALSANDTQYTAALNFAAVDVASPVTGTDGNSTSTLKAHLAGLTAAINGDASSQGSLTVSGFGFGNGPATLTRDDQVLLQGELNADANHTVDVTIGAQDANGAQPVSFSPALNVSLKVAMAPLSSQYNVPQELQNNSYGLSLTNNGQPASINLLSGDLMGLTDGSLQVAQGQLVLTSDQGNVTVPAGQCLTYNDSNAGPSYVTEQKAAPCSYNQ